VTNESYGLTGEIGKLRERLAAPDTAAADSQALSDGIEALRAAIAHSDDDIDLASLQLQLRRLRELPPEKRVAHLTELIEIYDFALEELAGREEREVVRFCGRLRRRRGRIAEALEAADTSGG
jgi:hypothetical protein